MQTKPDGPDLNSGRGEGYQGGANQHPRPNRNVNATNLAYDPHEVVFTLPFRTSDERMPSAASGFNELGCQMFGTVGSTSERSILASIGSNTLMVCNRDLKSAEPGNGLSETVTDLWLKW